MTPEQLKTLIEETIYDNVEGDITGSKLAGILEGIVDAIPEGPKVLDVEDFENNKIELTQQEYNEYLKNVHYIELENAQQTAGYLFELSPFPSLIAIIDNVVGDAVGDNNASIERVFGSETISLADDLVGVADYIALVGYGDSKFALVYVSYER